MKNYYEILEINEKASQEVIDKIYKVLVKKYHPDLQENIDTKTKYEEKIKEINEAYEVLSNPEKRLEYNNILAKEKEEILKKQNQTAQININNNPKQTKPQAQEQTNQNINNNYQNQINEQARKKAELDYQNAINKAYHDAYIQDLKNRGYKIKYKKTFNDYLKSMIAILITIGIILLICQLPFVKNYLNDVYNNNIFIHNMVDAFSNLFK